MIEIGQRVYRTDGDGEIIETVTVLNCSRVLLYVRGEDGQSFNVSPGRVREID